MLKIKKTNIREDIFLLEFETQEELTSTFLRFQEFYESPEFQGKVFTLDEYKEWYTKEKGSFTYYTDWSGFNVPSKILKPFYDGEFDPLTQAEQQFLDLFRVETKYFYIIGYYKNYPEHKKAGLLKHEIAHALFTLDSEYRNKVIETIGKYDTEHMQNILRETGGYAESVLIDEVNAYTLSGSEKLDDMKIDRLMKTELELFFTKFL